MRVGHGFDVHRFGGEPPLVLCGVVVSGDRGVESTSDGDVALHALIDALLGAAALGDIGEMFPSSDPRWEGASSVELLRLAYSRVVEAGYTVGNIDITIICQKVRIAPHRDVMRKKVAQVLSVDIGAVSVKATTTDGLGFIGLGEGLAVQAAVTLR
ncbi:MAG: 2-C-methyl-D-erythritol 2,4-cyclodiphosphate synthase [Acidobacteria bacterium]|nr:2-C-methyl-D-erythritol 2,4-cyclodiphosphate synthase [Acidobacteriota bacterium]MCH8986363.1 2-C-methyl-D-erythritol 2,4-cyclodiphosphate synthase [Acidobacteriota bacterium]